jgi:hypothetical protein
LAARPQAIFLIDGVRGTRVLAQDLAARVVVLQPDQQERERRLAGRQHVSAQAEKLAKESLSLPRNTETLGTIRTGTIDQVADEVEKLSGLTRCRCFEKTEEAAQDPT